jgi:hypothetical protein
MDVYAVITQLDYYADHIHFSPVINAWVLGALTREAPVAPGEAGQRLTKLREFVLAYDYAAIWAS